MNRNFSVNYFSFHCIFVDFLKSLNRSTVKRRRDAYVSRTLSNIFGDRVNEPVENHCDENPTQLFNEEEHDVYLFNEKLPYLSSSSNENVSGPASSDELIEEKESLHHLLKRWVIENNVTKSATSSLLSILKNYHPNLPSCAETLLRCDSNNVTVKNDSFAYFGIKSNVVTRIRAGIKDLSNRGSRYGELKTEACEKQAKLVSLQINFDGMPIFKSSSRNFWPILARVIESARTDPFVIGLHCGNGKPENVNDYLKLVVEELNNFEAPFEVDGKSFLLRVLCLICDAPARAYIKGVKSHSGFYGCDFCRQRGIKDSTSGRMLFPELNAPKRTDETFINNQEGGHQINDTIIKKIIPCINGVPPEYMHLVLEGAFKRLMKLWLPSDLKQSCRARLSVGQRAILSSSCSGFISSLPSEFHRRQFRIENYARWKATEFRDFLLYVAPFCLREVLKPEYYEHFCYFHFSIYSMAEESCQSNLIKSRLCLRKFVKDFGDYYGKDQLVYTIHVLSHLPKFCKILGCLDYWSSFPFENYLNILGRRIRASNKPLQQAVNRITELEWCGHVTKEWHIKISHKAPDNVVLTSSGVVLVEAFKIFENCVSGYVLQLIKETYKVPYDSSTFLMGQ